MGPFSSNNKFGRWLLSIIQGYSHEKYWKRKNIVVNPSNKIPLFLKLYYLYWIKKTDSRKNCSFGANLHTGPILSPPNLPHGPNGIIVGWDAKWGIDCTIYHQVTIAAGTVVIGNHVMIGAGAKILPNVKIGNYVKIGANCVVVEDIPDYATVVLPKPRILIK